MFVSFVIAALLAGVCAAGWILAELDLRDADRACAEAEHERDVVLGWEERRLVSDAVVHPTLTVLDGGER